MKEDTLSAVQIYLNEMGKCGVLSHDEIKEKYKYIEKNPTNRKRHLDEIVESHLRLVVHVAKKYQNMGLDFLDLIQEGNSGLMNCVKKFDYKLGYKFSPYATQWIKWEIIRAIDNDTRTIRVPTKMSRKIYKMKKGERELGSKLGRDSTEDEMAEKMEMSVEELRDIKKIDQQKSISLNTFISGYDENLTLEGYIEDENNASTSPFHSVLHKNLGKAIEEALKNLSKRETHVINMRFGLDDGIEHTLEEIGTHFKLTRERIRVIEEGALRKLRDSPISEKLRSYLDEKSESDALIKNYRNIKKNFEENLDQLGEIANQLIKYVNMIDDGGDEDDISELGKIFEDFTEILLPYIKGGVNIKKLFEDRASKFISRPSSLEKLTDREVEVAKRIGLGWGNEQISIDLFISKHTVRAHTKSLYDKLDINPTLKNVYARRMVLKEKINKCGL